MNNTRTALTVVFVAMGLLVGCTVSGVGQAKRGSPSMPAMDGEPPADSTSSMVVDIPPAPREISLDGLDPCTLLTEAQRSQLRVNDVDPGVGTGKIYQDMKECAFDADAEPFTTYSMIAVTNVDVSFWLSERRNADAELISIAGYPAAEFHTKDVLNSDCAIAIGVATNQHLHVEMEPLSEDLEQEQICHGSEQAAEMAMATLQAIK